MRRNAPLRKHLIGRLSLLGDLEMTHYGLTRNADGTWTCPSCGNTYSTPTPEDVEACGGRLIYAPPLEALEALANRALLDAVPGRITKLELLDGVIRVESSLDSPFADKTPSRWVTHLSAIDGHTILCDVVAQSVDRLNLDRIAADISVARSTAVPCPKCGKPCHDATRPCAHCEVDRV